MADKFLRNNSGTLTETEATVTSAGAGNAGDIVALDSTGRLDESVLPVGIGADTALILASEALSAGDFVNVYSNAGTANVRKADGTAAGKPADGFVLAAVSSSANATVYFEGTNTQCSGLTPGQQYLSGSTAGAAVSSAPSGAGKVVQKIGVAISTTALNFERGEPIVLA
jgi:hypothetical protein